MDREEAADWSRRYKANLDKLGSRDLTRVTEVIGDLELREHEAGLSAGERRTLDKARYLRRLTCIGWAPQAVRVELLGTGGLVAGVRHYAPYPR